MRSWVFKNRLRLEALYGRSTPAPPRATRPGGRTPRVVELVPARRPGERR